MRKIAGVMILTALLILSGCSVADVEKVLRLVFLRTIKSTAQNQLSPFQSEKRQPI